MVDFEKKSVYIGESKKMEKMMDDSKIIELYTQRNECAIKESQRKYGAYCYAIAYGILKIREDSEECVSDTWLKTWESIPPAKPLSLKAFLGKITRNSALNRYRAMNTEKRTDSNTQDVIYELSECLSEDSIPDKAYDVKQLGQAIGEFIKTLSKRDQSIFVGRYFYTLSVGNIAKLLGMSEKYVSNVLSRTRNKLKKYLEKEGFHI